LKKVDSLRSLISRKGLKLTDDLPSEVRISSTSKDSASKIIKRSVIR